MKLIHQQLIVGERLGTVPEATPLAPLQRDLAALQKRLRLPAEASWRDYDLDLRKPNDLERSHLLHRLNLLGIGWGKLQRSGGGKGTFHELWRLEWQPELAVTVIEAGIWGNTMSDAAAAYVADLAARATDLPTLTKLVDQALLADLASAVAFLMQRISQEAAVSSDVAHLMAALPPLAQVLRYGNVRNTDTQAVTQVVDGIVARMSIGLPGACTALNDQAAEELFQLLVSAHEAVALLERNDLLEIWQAALRRVATLETCHGLIAGRAVRILLDATILNHEQATRYLSVALSTASEPIQAAAWIEGFIRGSGSVLVHDERLWQIIDDWMLALHPDIFTQTVPFLRRTFTSFSAPERRALGERARTTHIAKPSTHSERADSTRFDIARGEAALAVILQLLGAKGDTVTRRQEDKETA